MMMLLSTLVALLLLLVQSTDALKLQGENLNECRIVTFFPFTDGRDSIPEAHAEPGVEYYGYGSWPSAESLAKASVSHVATAELARLHFNTRNDVVVPELKGLTKDCNVMIADPSETEAWYFDSAYSRVQSVETLLDLQGDNLTQAQASICAVVGPVDPKAHEGVSVLTENHDIPQLAYQTIDRRLDRREEFPTFTRMLPTGEDFAARLAEYLQRDILKRQYVGILYESSPLGEMFEDPLEDYEDELQYETLTEHLIEGDDESIYDALGVVIERGYRTMVLVTQRPALVAAVARIADELGLLGPGYLWFLSGPALPRALIPTLQYPVDSPMDKLLRGAGVLTNYDRFVYRGEEDPFLQAWRAQTDNTELLQRITQVQPHNDNNKPFYSPPSNYFATETPAEYASFVYDSVMAAGIGACQANATLNHQPAILATPFTGASGPVSFSGNSRDKSGVLFGLYNIRPTSNQSTTTTDGVIMQHYETVLTSIYSHENEYLDSDGTLQAGAWRNLPDVEFLYFDGTASEPLPLRSVANRHYISTTVFYSGLTLASVAVLVALLAMVWVYCHRAKRLVKASQPQFLYLLCFGALLVAASLYCISWDESRGWTETQLSQACAAFPWLFCSGYLILYCALFSKLWRLSKLLQMRRRAVGIDQVLWPFCIIITASLAVLIAWQVTDPLQWTRFVLEVDNDEAPLETYGQCDSPRLGVLPFLIPLAILFATIMILTSAIAWKLRDVQSDLSESKWIFFGIVTHIQVWAVGIPVAVITSSVSRDAQYLMYVAFGFLFSISQVLLVIGPKVYSHYSSDQYGNKWCCGRADAGVKRERSTKWTQDSSNASMTNVTSLLQQQPSQRSTRSQPASGLASSGSRVSELEQEVKTLQTRLKEIESSSAFLSTGSKGTLEGSASLRFDTLPEDDEEEEEDRSVTKSQPTANDLGEIDCRTSLTKQEGEVVGEKADDAESPSRALEVEQDGQPTKRTASTDTAINLLRL